MRTRWRWGGPYRVAAAAVVGLALVVAGCASTEPRLAQSAQAEAWGKCDPTPRTTFTLVCFKR